MLDANGLLTEVCPLKLMCYTEMTVKKMHKISTGVSVPLKIHVHIPVVFVDNMKPDTL